MTRKKFAKIVVTPPGKKARNIVERSKKYSSPSFKRLYPLVVESAHGSIVRDVDGNQFLDFSSGIAVLNTGSTHTKIVEAAKNQLDKFTHFSYTDFYYSNFVDLSEKLCALVPGDFDKMVFWANSGTEANEAAMKLARNHTRRPLFLAHGGRFTAERWVPLA
ncbi:MAG: aminotransferase class III-fold pyridoxal phosphate-dependent enzyme [Thaumarchaeota archaeon]|nr:aminotransferase class III-fold pyridoxal phosphate-dependent enzyme [Nitrososphaerota archaeon]